MRELLVRSEVEAQKRVHEEMVRKMCKCDLVDVIYFVDRFRIE